MRSFNVGILGYGAIGKVHAYSYATLPFYYQPPPLQARIVSVCTSRRETAEAARAQLNADEAVLDFRRITENPAIDIVHICTPNHLHKEALLSALHHNKHIYCDKPLTATLAEAEEIRAALKGYTGTAQMVFNNRFFPATMRAKQLASEGFLGQPLTFRACYLHSGSVDPRTPLKWKLSAAAGGGILADMASHVFDIVHVLLGDYAALQATTQIAYTTRPSPDDPTKSLHVDTEDAAYITARMKNGAVGQLEATKIATGSEDELRIEVHGAKGALRFNLMDPHHLELYDATAPETPLGGTRGWTRVDAGQRYGPPCNFPAVKVTPGWLRGHVGCLANFLTCVSEGRPAEPGLAHGVYIQQLIECARASAREGRWVEV
jgi:predicted dehydrogenase